MSEPKLKVGATEREAMESYGRSNIINSNIINTNIINSDKNYVYDEKRGRYHSNIRYGEMERDIYISYNNLSHLKDKSFNKDCVCYQDDCICSELTISEKIQFLQNKINKKFQEEEECDCV